MELFVPASHTPQMGRVQTAGTPGRACAVLGNPGAWEVAEPAQGGCVH